MPLMRNKNSRIYALYIDGPYRDKDKSDKDKQRISFESNDSPTRRLKFGIGRYDFKPLTVTVEDLFWHLRPKLYVDFMILSLILRFGMLKLK